MTNGNGSEGVWCGVLHVCGVFPTPGPLARPAPPQTAFIPHDENAYIPLSTFHADARVLLTAGARLGIDPEHPRPLTGGLYPLTNISPPPLHFTPAPGDHHSALVLGVWLVLRSRSVCLSVSGSFQPAGFLSVRESVCLTECGLLTSSIFQVILTVAQRAQASLKDELQNWTLLTPGGHSLSPGCLNSLLSWGTDGGRKWG